MDEKIPVGRIKILVKPFPIPEPVMLPERPVLIQTFITERSGHFIAILKNIV